MTIESLQRAFELGKQMLRAMLFLVVLLLASSVFAQRGTLAVASKPVGALAIVIPPFKQPTFTWDNPPGASNKISWGLARDAWTNGSRTITTNSFPRTNGWHYKVTAIVDGVESVPALWPSNRIAQYWLKDLGTNFQGARMITNETLLSTYTNNPYDGQHAWQIEDRTIRWE